MEIATVLPERQPNGVLSPLEYSLLEAHKETDRHLQTLAFADIVASAVRPETKITSLSRYVESVYTGNAVELETAVEEIVSEVQAEQFKELATPHRELTAAAEQIESLATIDILAAPSAAPEPIDAPWGEPFLTVTSRAPAKAAPEVKDTPDDIVVSAEPESAVVTTPAPDKPKELDFTPVRPVFDPKRRRKDRKSGEQLEKQRSRRRRTLGKVVLAGAGLFFAPTSITSGEVDHAAMSPLPAETAPLSFTYKESETWITSLPSSYYRYSYFKQLGHKFIKLRISKSGKYAFGKVKYSNNPKEALKCGWIEASGVDEVPLTPNANDPCMDQVVPLRKRETFGKGYNGRKYKYVDGVRVVLPETCNAKLTLVEGQEIPIVFPGILGGNKIKVKVDHTVDISKAPVVYYRYTEDKNDKWAIVRNPEYGWGRLQKAGCIEGYPKGGTRKRKTAEAGDKPYTDRPTKKLQVVMAGGNIQISPAA